VAAKEKSGSKAAAFQAKYCQCVYYREDQHSSRKILAEGSRGCNGFRMFSRNKTAGEGRTNIKRRVQARSLGMFFVGIAVAMTLSPAYSEKATHKVWSVDWEQFWPRELSGEAQQSLDLQSTEKIPLLHPWKTFLSPSRKTLLVAQAISGTSHYQILDAGTLTLRAEWESHDPDEPTTVSVSDNEVLGLSQPKKPSESVPGQHQNSQALMPGTPC
jgi:hypothetical protein